MVLSHMHIFTLQETSVVWDGYIFKLEKVGYLRWKKVHLGSYHSNYLVCLYTSVFTFKFLNIDELALPKKLQMIALQREIPKNKITRGLSSDFTEWTLFETSYVNISLLLPIKQHVVLFV